MKYPTNIEDQKDWVVIETTDGCYGDDGFCYMSARRTLEDAIAEFKDSPKVSRDWRVVNREGVVLYNPNNLLPLTNGL